MAQYINPIVPGERRYPTITPFTYRDGLTYLKTLELLLKAMKELIDKVNDNSEELTDLVVEILNEKIEEINTALSDQEASVDTKIEALETWVNNEVTQINDYVNGEVSSLTQYVNGEVATLTQYVNDKVDEILDASVEIQDPIVAQMVSDTTSDTRQALNGLFAEQSDIDSLQASVNTHTTNINDLQDKDEAQDNVITNLEQETTTKFGVVNDRLDTLEEIKQIDLISEIEYPVIVSHRGSAQVGLDSSLEAFKESYDAGYPLEFDIRLLNDGKFAVWHDTHTGSKISGDSTAISSMSTKQWRERKIMPVFEDNIKTTTHGTVCTLDDLLNKYGGRTVLFPEIKDETQAAADELIGAIKKRGLQRSIIVQTLTWGLAQDFIVENIPVMYRNPTETPAQCAAAGIEYIGIPASRRSEIPSWRAEGLKPIIFTNDRDIYLDLMSLNCDGIISDDPWRITQEPSYGATLEFEGNREPGMLAESDGNATVEIRGNSITMHQSEGPNTYSSVTLGKLGYGSNRVRIGLTVNSLTPRNDPPTESTLMFGLYLGKREGGLPVLPGSHMSETMYRGVVVRRDGRMQLYNKASFTSDESNLGGSPNNPNAETGEPSGDMDFEIVFSNNSFQVTNLTRGIKHSETHTPWNEHDDLYITLHARGANSKISNIWSQQII